MVKLEREIVTGDQILVSIEPGGCTLAFCDKAGTPIYLVSPTNTDSKFWLNGDIRSRDIISLVSLLLGKSIQRVNDTTPTRTLYKVL